MMPSRQTSLILYPLFLTTKLKTSFAESNTLNAEGIPSEKLLDAKQYKYCSALYRKVSLLNSKLNSAKNELEANKAMKEFYDTAFGGQTFNAFHSTMSSGFLKEQFLQEHQIQGDETSRKMLEITEKVNE